MTPHIPAATLEAWCTQHPLALPALHDRGIAHGVGPAPRGGAGLGDASTATLADACRARGVDLQPLVAEVDATERALADAWLAHGLPDLLEHLLVRYHEPFRARAAELEAAFAAAGGGPWLEARAVLAEIRAEMIPHMGKEEQVLFPWLRVRSETAAAPIRVMQLEHADMLQLLHALHAAVLCAAAVMPDRDALTLHAAFERWMCEHIYLENNVLFPRALGLDDAEHAS